MQATRSLVDDVAKPISVVFSGGAQKRCLSPVGLREYPRQSNPPAQTVRTAVVWRWLNYFPGPRKRRSASPVTEPETDHHQDESAYVRITRVALGRDALPTLLHALVGLGLMGLMCATGG